MAELFTPELIVAFLTLTALELVLGIDSKVFGPLHLGWTVRYKRRLFHNDGTLGATWYVPGFGINDKENLAANFNVIIDI